MDEPRQAPYAIAWEVRNDPEGGAWNAGFDTIDEANARYHELYLDEGIVSALLVKRGDGVTAAHTVASFRRE